MKLQIKFLQKKMKKIPHQICTCKKGKRLSLHPCPYKCEIEDDDVSECNCCYFCIENCKNEI